VHTLGPYSRLNLAETVHNGEALKTVDGGFVRTKCVVHVVSPLYIENGPPNEKIDRY